MDPEAATIAASVPGLPLLPLRPGVVIFYGLENLPTPVGPRRGAASECGESFADVVLLTVKVNKGNLSFTYKNLQ